MCVTLTHSAPSNLKIMSTNIGYNSSTDLLKVGIKPPWILVTEKGGRYDNFSYSFEKFCQDFTRQFMPLGDQ